MSYAIQMDKVGRGRVIDRMGRVLLFHTVGSGRPCRGGDVKEEI